jgi:hypothetical protein
MYPFMFPFERTVCLVGKESNRPAYRMNTLLLIDMKMRLHGT